MKQNKGKKDTPLEGQTGEEGVVDFDKLLEAMPLEERLAFERERAARQAELSAHFPHLAAKAGKQRSKPTNRPKPRRPRRRGRRVPSLRNTVIDRLYAVYSYLLYMLGMAVQLSQQGVTWGIGTTRRFARAGTAVVGKAARQVWRHVVSPLCGFACVFLGVCLSALVPASLWVGLSSIEQLVGVQITAFPIGQLPDLATWLVILPVALPIAIVVFREGAYSAWKASDEPLLARMLYTVAAGIRWPKVWFRRRQTPPNGQLPPNSPATP